MPAPRATWEEMDRRINDAPAKDQKFLSTWVAHRRDVQEVAPGTMRCDLQRLVEASRALEKPLEAAARDGELAAWAKERAKRVPSDPWFFLSRFRLILSFHDLPAAWTVAPRAGPTTRKRREKAKKRRTFRVVSTVEFEGAVKACLSPMHRAQLYMLWDTGMRPGELLSLHVDGIELKGDGTWFAHMPAEEEAYYALKTGSRSVALVESVAALKEWMNHHPTRKGPLWPGKKGDFMSMHAFQDMVKGACPGHTPKDFRHTAATRATLQGWNEAQMRAYFGWEKASPMPSYYSEFTAADANSMRLRMAGLLPSKKGREEEHVLPIQCPHCNTPNVRQNVYCFACKGSLRVPASSPQDADRLAREAKLDLLIGLMEDQLGPDFTKRPFPLRSTAGGTN